MCEIIEKVADKKAEKTRIDTLVTNVRMMVKNAGMTILQAMDTLEIENSDRETIMKRI